MAGWQLDGVPLDDRQYLVDLGLVRRSPQGGLVIANRIYQEVLPRVPASSPQDRIMQTVEPKL